MKNYIPPYGPHESKVIFFKAATVTDPMLVLQTNFRNL